MDDLIRHVIAAGDECATDVGALNRRRVADMIRVRRRHDELWPLRHDGSDHRRHVPASEWIIAIDKIRHHLVPMHELVRLSALDAVHTDTRCEARFADGRVVEYQAGWHRMLGALVAHYVAFGLQPGLMETFVLATDREKGWRFPHVIRAIKYEGSGMHFVEQNPQGKGSTIEVRYNIPPATPGQVSIPETEFWEVSQDAKTLGLMLKNGWLDPHDVSPFL